MSLLNRRRMMFKKRELPIGYERLKYISTSRHQWINTEIYPSCYSVFEGDIDMDNTTRNTIMFGAGTYLSAYHKSFALGHGTTASATNLAVVFGNKVTSRSDLDCSGRHVWRLDYEYVLKDGVQYLNTPTLSMLFTSNYPLAIGGFYRDGLIQAQSKIKIYYARLSDVLTKVIDYNAIPALRTSDDKPGLYDTVSKSFFTNAGPGEFGYEKLDGTIVKPV